MLRALALAVLTAVSALSLVPSMAAGQSTRSSSPLADPAAARKLYDLGYPTDTRVAVQRWRNDNRRSGDGPLTEEEVGLIQAQPVPKFFSAMTGNPFTGMGLALKHTDRAEAERDAVRVCKKEGGASTCTSPIVVRDGLCVVVVGYTATVDRRPWHRVSVAISSDIKLAGDRGMEGCQTGATHPQLCRTLITFCGDGSNVEIFDDTKKQANAAR